jgi:hypothetical protein
MRTPIAITDVKGPEVWDDGVKGSRGLFVDCWADGLEGSPRRSTEPAPVVGACTWDAAINLRNKASDVDVVF